MNILNYFRHSQLSATDIQSLGDNKFRTVVVIQSENENVELHIYEVSEITADEDPATEYVIKFPHRQARQQFEVARDPEDTIQRITSRLNDVSVYRFEEEIEKKEPTDFFEDF